MPRLPAAPLAAACTAALALPAAAQPCDHAWSQPGNGLGSSVFALTVYNGDLVAGGQFSSEVGGPSFSLPRVARWDGLSWSPLGVGLSGFVRDFLEVDGLLLAGGNFTHIGPSTSTGTPASRIAVWDGESWAPHSPAVINGQIMDLEVFQGELYAAGTFSTIDGEIVNHVARWDGAAWRPVRAGDFGSPGADSSVYCLAVFDSGDGPVLYAGGTFDVAGDATASHIAMWDGAAWHPVGAGINGTVTTLRVFDDGSGAGPALYAGGTFNTADFLTVTSIAKWDGESWAPVGALGGEFTSFSVHALTPYDDGSGNGTALYAGGTFTTADGAPAPRIARWDGASWSPVGEGIASSGQVSALAVYDDGLGPGPALYAGGAFNNASGGPGDRVARWGCAGSACPADWDDDGLINSNDISAFLSDWLAAVQGGTLDADFNQDGAVNSNDISALLAAWLDAVTNGC